MALYLQSEGLLGAIPSGLSVSSCYVLSSISPYYSVNLSVMLDFKLLHTSVSGKVSIYVVKNALISSKAVY